MMKSICQGTLQSFLRLLITHKLSPSISRFRIPMNCATCIPFLRAKASATSTELVPHCLAPSMEICKADN